MARLYTQINSMCEFQKNCVKPTKKIFLKQNNNTNLLQNTIISVKVHIEFLYVLYIF